MIERITKISKEDILNREFNRYEEKRIMLEFQLAYQRQLDPNEYSAEKVLSRGSDGRPTSKKSITRKEYIEILEKDLEDTKVILATIGELEKTLD